jgi:hypothetical protein
MSESTYRVRHKISGVIDENCPAHIVEHVELGKYFEVVGPDAKPYLPEMHRTSLPADPTPDQLEVARVAGFTNPAAFEKAVEEAKAKTPTEPVVVVDEFAKDKDKK